MKTILAVNLYPHKQAVICRLCHYCVITAIKYKKRTSGRRGPLFAFRAIWIIIFTAANRSDRAKLLSERPVLNFHVRMDTSSAFHVPSILGHSGAKFGHHFEAITATMKPVIKPSSHIASSCPKVKVITWRSFRLRRFRRR